MRAMDIIIKKRGTFAEDENGKRCLQNVQQNTKEEIEFMIEGCTNGSIPEYQMASYLMAIFFNGMTFEETGFLTNAMLRSGDVIDFHKGGANKDVFYVDKHSTGGVGDKISLPLAAIVSACGLKDPMMSGRALGHTGGTLDKLESINGYCTKLSEQQFIENVNKYGYAMIGQTEKIAPADKILYALRDVTGTVESIPLITASILSKKIAEGADGLVFDVKYGKGAFMKSKSDANTLAEFLVKTAQSMGKKACALITNMNSPLGDKIGNFLEIEETIECLQNKGPKDVMELTYELASQMLLMANLAKNHDEAMQKCKNAVTSKKALEKFLENVEVQGGNPCDLMQQIGNRRSPFSSEICADKDGFLDFDAYKIGIAGITLGIGRSKTTDSVCADAGIILHKHAGDFVKKGELIMEIFGKNKDCLSPAKNQLLDAITFSEKKCEAEPLIYKMI